MSLTSYRAAPPRDKPLRAFEKPIPKRIGQRPRAPIDPVRRLPEKATRANALGCEAYVPTRARFGKGRRPSFRDFMRVRPRIITPNSPTTAALARKPAKAQRWAKDKRGTPWISR